MKRIIIAVTRNFEDYDMAERFIKNILSSVDSNENITIISGGCRGADSLGEKYAKNNGMIIEIYKANLKRYGRAAGPIRNKEMVLASDAVICF